MWTFILHLLFLWPSMAWSLEVDQLYRQKRQLDWQGGRVYHYDHLAISSNQEEQLEDDSSIETVTSASGLPGEPGIDYPILPSIPLTDFHCRGRDPGFYGDTQTACQVFHVCDMSGRQDSFLCPNGTIFSQKLFACDWWYNVQCAVTRQHYQLNRNLYRGSNLNLYGTPSFWNWLSDTEETYPQPGQTRPASLSAPKSSTRQQKARPNLVVDSSPTPLALPLQLEQPAPTIQPLPTAAPVVFIPPPTPAVTTTPTSQFIETAETEQPEGFTRDYEEYYFGWIHDPVEPPSSDMVPELSWSDLGPNGPMMSEQPPTQSVDRRRKTKPIQQQKPVAKKQPNRPAPVPVAAPKPNYVPKQVPVKKVVQSPPPKRNAPAPITSAPKFIAPQPPISTKINPALSLSPPPIYKTKPKQTPKPSPKPITKQKPKQTAKPVTKTSTTKRPTAQSDYFYDDDTYDDSSIRLDQPRQKSRAAISSPPHHNRSGNRRKNKNIEQTRFIPSSRVTNSRSDDLVAEPYSRYAKPIQSTTPRAVQPSWNQRVDHGRTLNRPFSVPRNPILSSRLQLTSRTEATTFWPPAKPIQSSRSVHQATTPVPGLVMERLAPTFRPSAPIPAITTNSDQPRVRALRAHPSPSTGVKRKRKTKELAYDPRLGRPYAPNHPIWKLQNWESTKL